MKKPRYGIWHLNHGDCNYKPGAFPAEPKPNLNKLAVWTFKQQRIPVSTPRINYASKWAICWAWS